MTSWVILWKKSYIHHNSFFFHFQHQTVLVCGPIGPTCYLLSIERWGQGDCPQITDENRSRWGWWPSAALQTKVLDTVLRSKPALENLLTVDGWRWRFWNLLWDDGAKYQTSANRVQYSIKGKVIVTVFVIISSPKWKIMTSSQMMSEVEHEESIWDGAFKISDKCI